MAWRMEAFVFRSPEIRAPSESNHAIRLERTAAFAGGASRNGHRSSLEAVVVGAGQAGVAASNELRARGIEHEVFERGRVGETWRSNAGTLSS
jgi:hypothetical protein